MQVYSMNDKFKVEKHTHKMTERQIKMWNI